MSVLYLLLLLILGLLLEHLSRKYCLDKLSYDLRLSSTLVECGERFEMISSVTNGKRLPVMYLRISEDVPPVLSVELEGSGISRQERRVAGVNSISTLNRTMFSAARRSRQGICWGCTKRAQRRG